MTMTKRVTDFDIQAYIDDELEAEDAHRIGEFIENNKWARQRYLELVRQNQILLQWWSTTKKH